MARVHRMNQTQQTQVVRFVVNDSIEAALHSLNADKFASMDMANGGNGAADAPLALSDVAALLSDA
jgi:SNF2 family DNA or RNA helicase